MRFLPAFLSRNFKNSFSVMLLKFYKSCDSLAFLTRLGISKEESEIGLMTVDSSKEFLY